jgi:hypothetical protein
VLFVRKKNGNLRMCIDYRVLNKMTVRNEYPLSKIDELLDMLHSTRFFTTITFRLINALVTFQGIMNKVF